MRSVAVRMLLLLLFVSLFSSVSVFRVKASGTIYIRPNGSIQPPTANITTSDLVTYIFSGNNYESLVIERDNVVLDGAGYTLQGPGSLYDGIKLQFRTNVTIKNVEIRHFTSYGIELMWTTDTTICGTTVTNNAAGIVLHDSDAVTVSANYVANNSDGIWLEWSTDNTISQNNITENTDDAIVLIYSSNNNIVSGNVITNNSFGMGIRVWSAFNNTICENDIFGSLYNGIYLHHASSGNNISENRLMNNGEGIGLYDSANHNQIHGNTIVNNNGNGIEAHWFSEHNIIFQNNVTNNGHGFYVFTSSNNTIFHNSCVDNIEQVYSFNSTNIWDDSYPSGGNFWSDYNGTDLFSGPFQNVTGGDNIGDVPYIIDVKNQDNYPLMASWERPTDWWLMLQHDLQHTGYSTSEMPNTLSSLWNFSDRDDAYCSAPVISNGMVLVNLFGPWISNGVLWALNETTGAPIWSFQMGPMAYNSPAVSQNRIFVGGNDGRFYCLNLNGCLLWNFTCEYNPYLQKISPIKSSPTIDSGKVYFLTEGGYFYALNITDGQVVWIYHTPSLTFEESSPAIWSDIVYFGSVAGGFRAVNTTNGSEIWKFTTGNYVTSGPVVIGGKAYIGSADSNFYCLNATNGTLLWNFTSGGPIFYESAIFEDKVFFSDRQGWYGETSKLYALGTSDGALLWNVSIDKRVRTSVIVADGKVFVGSPAADGAHLYTFNLTNGALIWHYITPGSWKLGRSFAICNYKLFVGSDKVYAFGERIPIIDVAIINCTTSKTGCLPMETVGNGATSNITLTVENQGDFTETFNVTAKANTTIIGVQAVTLNPGENQTLNFVWNTTLFAHGDYIISAEATIVPSETDTMDNALIYGVIRVTWLGDVDGDGDVDIFDIVRMATIYGTLKPDPVYDPNCDIDDDGDIDIFDIVAAAGHYGESW